MAQQKNINTVVIQNTDNEKGLSEVLLSSLFEPRMNNTEKAKNKNRRAVLERSTKNATTQIEINMLGFILNLPYTILGLIVGLISVPREIQFEKSSYIIILNIRSFWWVFGYMKKARAMTIGHAILLGPKLEPTDLSHELIHVRQFDKWPIIFPLLYAFQIFRYGHKGNKYEIEAYGLSGGKSKYYIYSLASNPRQRRKIQSRGVLRGG